MYAAYSRVFAYDSAASSNASIEVEQSTRLWTRQRIVFDAAYGGERMVLYLYLPSRARRPIRGHLWPGGAARNLGSIDEFEVHGFVVKSGRAVAFRSTRGRSSAATGRRYRRRTRRPIATTRSRP